MLFSSKFKQNKPNDKNQGQNLYTHIIPVIVKTKKIEPSDGRRVSGHFWVEGS